MEIISTRGMVTSNPLAFEIDTKATTAAAMGEQVMPTCEATDATPQGRSGRMPFFSAMSQIMGISVYTTWPVPTSTVRKNVHSGARNVMRSGCLRSMRSANCISQSMPPDACMMPAQVTAAMMM